MCWEHVARKAAGTHCLVRKLPKHTASNPCSRYCGLREPDVTPHDDDHHDNNNSTSISNSNSNSNSPVDPRRHEPMRTETRLEERMLMAELADSLNLRIKSSSPSSTGPGSPFREQATNLPHTNRAGAEMVHRACLDFCLGSTRDKNMVAMARHAGRPCLVEHLPGD